MVLLISLPPGEWPLPPIFAGGKPSCGTPADRRLKANKGKPPKAGSKSGWSPPAKK